MKIGIITFHRAQNYGAVLQCYALYCVLKSLGHDVEVIDYYPKYFKQEYSVFSLSKPYKTSILTKIKYVLNTIPVLITKFKRKIAFEKFLSNIRLSSIQYKNDKQRPYGYDCIFFGSDQIWNPNLTYGEDKIFIGDFLKGKTRFFSYAASSSPTTFTDDFRNYYKKIINNFDSISTRERNFSIFLNSLQDNCSQSVLDPTLLPNLKILSDIASEPDIKDYLLIYTVPQSDSVYELAKMIAKEKKLKIIEIRPNVRFHLDKNIIQTASPSEFLGYFKNASFVVTTSFHGTCFSVKFQKQFVTLALGNAIDNRATDFLKSINLEYRIILKNNLYVPSVDIDYQVVNSLLAKQIEISINYVKDCLRYENKKY